MGEQFSGNYGKLAKIGLWACKISLKALFRAKELWQNARKPPQGM
jgi:hypothetical protein